MICAESNAMTGVMGKRRAVLALTAMFAMAMPSFSAAGFAEDPAQEDRRDYDLSTLSLEDLARITVITASRSEEKLTRSTSVMSVITARDIERSGFRTIYEVLARVPGFFPTTQATWKLVGTRGLVADGNDHILLLIDGHPQNSIVAHGYQQQDQMPTLEKVERIEIIRGPGSVLWGASAAHAIINVVTKDEIGNGNTVSLTTGYGSADGLFNVNFIKDIHMGDGKGIFSASYWKATGYNAPDGPNVKFPWGASTNSWPRLDAQNPGFEIYVKLKQAQDQQLLVRLAETNVPYPWDSWSYDPAAGVRPGGQLRMRKAYVDYQKTHSISPRLDIQYTLYGDMLLQNRFPSQLSDDATGLDTRWMEDQSREELAFGAETGAVLKLGGAHTLRVGSKFVHTIAGPNRGFRFDTYTNLPTAPGPGEEQVPVIDIRSGRDNSIAAYAEHHLTLLEGRMDAFAGVRADHNDWREKRTVVLPRAGVIHSLTNHLTAKYVFNAGYLRPNAAYSKSSGKFYRSPSKTIEDVNVVDRSEEVRSHDLQFSYSRGASHIIGTLFHMNVDNFISWETKLDLGYRNMGAATTNGVELEGRYALTNNVALTGNYSFARAFLREIPTGTDINGVPQLLDGAVTNLDREWLNYPKHAINAGAEFTLHPGQTLNANLRGWHTMNIIAPYNSPKAGQYDVLGGRFYLDLNYAAKNIVPNYDFSVFASNLFNNTEPIGMVINNGVYHPRGRSFGFGLSRRF